MTKNKSHQVIGAKLKYQQYSELQKKCLEKNYSISKVIKKGVDEYLNSEFIYKLNGWVISIIDIHNTGNFSAFAVKEKFYTILTIENYYEHDNEHDYIIVNYDDVVVYYLENIDTTNHISVLCYTYLLINNLNESK